MPRSLLLASPFLLAAGLLAAAEAPSAPPRDGDVPPTADTPREEAPLPRPAPTFTPREKISADSAVAFPVDI